MLSLKSEGSMSTLIAAVSSLLMALLLGSLSGDAQQAATPKPNCQTSCGIPIPYPFGIGDEGCFLNEWYEIVCQQDMTTPSLKKIDLEVKSISLPDYNKIEPAQATILVSLPVIYSNESCSHNKPTSSVLPSLVGSPFVYSVRENVLLAFGCNYLTVISQAGSVLGGCNCTCREQESFGTFGYSAGEERCCSSGIQESALQQLSIEVIMREGTARPGQHKDCGRAVLMDKSTSNATVSDSPYSPEYVIAVLEWGIPGDTHLAADLSNRCPSCQKLNNGTFPDSIDRFSCRKGYIGNPYITNGCTGKTNYFLSLLPLFFRLSGFTL